MRADVLSIVLGPRAASVELGNNATQILKMPLMLSEMSAMVSFSIMPASRTHTGSKSP